MLNSIKNAIARQAKPGQIMPGDAFEVFNPLGNGELHVLEFLGWNGAEWLADISNPAQHGMIRVRYVEGGSEVWIEPGNLNITQVLRAAVESEVA